MESVSPVAMFGVGIVQRPTDISDFESADENFSATPPEGIRRDAG